MNYRADDPGDSGSPGFPSDVAAAGSLSGCIPAPYTDMVINGNEPPAYLIHGTNDNLVPYDCAVATRDRALAVGDVAVLETRQGAGHVPGPTSTDLASFSNSFFQHVI